jgi:hypothetical protein
VPVTDVFGVPADEGPWFQRRPRLTLVVAVVLFAAVFVLRLMAGGPADVTNMLYCLPVALVALAFGFRAGIAAGVVGFALVVLWVVIDGVHLSPLGWTTRALPLLLLGALLGDAADRLRASEEKRRQLDRAAHWHRQAVEINDSIVQGLAVAKWSLEAGQNEQALETVTETLDQAHTLVSDLLRDAGLGGATYAPGRQEAS